MTTKALIRFDPASLKAHAGDKVFARGEAYFRQGMVDILGVEPDRVLARVAGTEDYRTIVSGQGRAIDGQCSCPAFERDGFCKHMVAVALAANAASASGMAEDVGPLARIGSYLKSRDTDTLVKMIMDSAERDPALMRRLEIAAAAENTDDEALGSKLRGAIDDATRTRGFVDYQRAAGWAAGVEAALDALEDMASGPRAALVVELAGHTATRIEKAIDEIDDSDGYCGDLLERARQIHFDACQTARPDPVALARDLFLRETQGSYDTFYAAAEQYAEVLGETGLGEYRRLTQAAWNKLPPQSGPRRRGDERSYDMSRLRSIMDFFAERDGDLEARIALRSKDLSSPWGYLQLAQFCLEHGREEDALRHAEEGLWLFEDDRPDERLVTFTVELLLKAGRKGDAQAHLWQAFRKGPNLELYRRMRTNGGEEAGRRIVEHLQGQLAGTPASQWHSPADLLIQIMIEEMMFEAAWAVASNHRVSLRVREALARASEATHAQQALAVYGERVEALAHAGGNPAYQEAAALIARMGALRGPAEHAAYVIALRQRHGRKRNFMKLLG